MSQTREEFERTALPHLRSLLRFARRITGSAAQAEDLVQETYLLAWRGFNGYTPGSNIRAWLFRILINANRGVARRRFATIPIPTAESLPGGKLRAEPFEVLDALDRLPEEQRTVLSLCAIEGFTGPEVSEILGVPLGTVMSRLSRARQAMRHLLASRMEKVSK
ncbi:MAG: sigma-70 family RNA polymerase sigma factor [Acidobacteriota bacterium]|nr:sigma-70 family RNA polymerase sigma factor [Acidobacteriota bacterium]